MAKRRDGIQKGSTSGGKGEDTKNGNGGGVSISGGVAGNRTCGKAKGRQAEMGTKGSRAHDEQAMRKGRKC